MVILFVLFVVQFSIACACLAVSEMKKLEYAQRGWNSADNSTIIKTETYFDCCGFSGIDNIDQCVKVTSTK